MFKPIYRVGHYVYVTARIVFVCSCGEQVNVLARADGIVNFYLVRNKRGQRRWLPENILSDRSPQKKEKAAVKP